MNRPVRAKKSLGQNFLVDPNYQKKIVDALQLRDDDELIEIGPGTGAITQHMVAKVRRFTAVELDDQLAAALRDRYADVPSFHLVHQDVMTVPFAELVENIEAVKVVGNIPYNITSPLIFKLLERDARPAAILFMVQKEVADRIVAPPGEKDFGALSVGVQAVASAERLEEESDLRTLTRAAFAMRRKQFQKILRSAEVYGLSAEGVAALETRLGRALSARPEELSPEQFVQMSKLLREMGYPQTDAVA
jgi:16S rRNA (adenine1518-N6/adenine1519-N6)-dimethyltransferase